MKHPFQSGKPDGADIAKVRPGNWNALHIHGTSALSADTTLNESSHDVVLATGGALGITLTLPPSVISGRTYFIKKVDSGVGSVHIVPSPTYDIESLASFDLIDQFQFVKLVLDGTRWHIIGQN
jgi:hypothetical protein